MRDKPIILKLGGSVVTKKEQPFTPNKRVIRRLSKEIEQAEVRSLILIHGGGSFGHPIAKKHKIKEGYTDQSQILGFSKTHQAMVSLNKMVVDGLVQKEIPAVTVQPSAFITTNNGRIRCIETKIIFKLLELGITPVLYGDVVLDTVLGFTILSGDQLVSSIAMKLGVDRIIMGVDVDGLYTTDPKREPSARLIQQVNLRELETFTHQIGESEVPDVTGGMYGKIQELVPVVAKGVKAIIVNAIKPNNVCRALRGEMVIGTTIEVG